METPKRFEDGAALLKTEELVLEALPSALAEAFALSLGCDTDGSTGLLRFPNKSLAEFASVFVAPNRLPASVGCLGANTLLVGLLASPNVLLEGESCNLFSPNRFDVAGAWFTLPKRLVVFVICGLPTLLFVDGAEFCSRFPNKVLAGDPVPCKLAKIPEEVVCGSVDPNMFERVEEVAFKPAAAPVDAEEPNIFEGAGVGAGAVAFKFAKIPDVVVCGVTDPNIFEGAGAWD